MLKEAKNIDFYTTGKEPSKEDFARISEWIRSKKERSDKVKRATNRQKNSTSLKATQK